MKPNQLTNHAIRIVLLLAKDGSVVSSNTLSRKVNLSKGYLFRIMAALRKTGFVSVTYGQVGGYCLAKDPADISIYDVFTALEGQIQLPNQASSSSARTGLEMMYAIFREYMENYTRLFTFNKLVAYSEDEIKALIRNFLVEDKSHYWESEGYHEMESNH